MTADTPNPDSSKPGKSIAIIAKKNLHANTRIVRQCSALERNGFRVTVICETPPHVEHVKNLKNTEFVCVSRDIRTSNAAVAAMILFTLSICAIFTKTWSSAFLAMSIQWLSKRSDNKNPPPSFLDREGSEKNSTPRETRTYTTMARSRIRAAVLNFLLNRPVGIIGLPLVSDILFSRRTLRAMEERRFAAVQAHDANALLAAYALTNRGIANALLYDAVENPTDRGGWSSFKPETRGNVRRAYARIDAALAPIIRSASATITVSEGLADWMQGHYRMARPQVVRNFRPYQEVSRKESPLRHACELDDDAKLLLQLNSIVPDSGADVLVEILSDMPETVHLALLGQCNNPAYLDSLVARAEELEIGNRFHILQPVASGAVVNWAAGADLGIVALQDTSHNNRISLPNRIFEFLMARTPIAASNLPDIKRFVCGHDIGDVFDPMDHDDILQCLKALLAPGTNETLRTRMDDLNKTMNWESESERYLQVIDSLEVVACQPGNTK